MRKLTVKYGGECKRCGAILEAGQPAMYEKSTGVFCVGCEPTDSEEIRHFRTLKAEARAERYENWAEKREAQARADLNSYPSIRHDWAFITQPGRIPFRERMNRSDERACESLRIAEEFRAKAESLRHIKVAGDAEKKRQAKRELLDTLIKKGSRVADIVFGEGEVVGVYSKSYRIRFDRGYTHSRDKSYIRPIQEANL